MTSLDQILMERGCRYGSFIDVANRAATLFHVMTVGRPSIEGYHAHALHMIAVKIARLAEGRIDDLDSWFDIAGYAMLVHNQIVQEQETKAAPSPFNDKTVMDAMEEQITKDMDEKVA